MPTTHRLPGLLRRLWHHLSLRRQRQLALVAGLMLASALAEAISLGAVLPFLGIMSAPDRVFGHPFFASIAPALGITSSQQLVLPLTLVFVAATVVAASLRMLVLWANTRVGFAAGTELSIDLYRRTLYQPYSIHVARNSSEVISGIVNKINGAVFGVLLAVLTFLSSTILIVIVMIALMVIDPVVATVATVGFGASYAGITWMVRKRLARDSRRIADEQTRIVQALQEGLGGIRDVLLDGTQPVYCDIYRQADQQLRRAQASVSFIGHSPRYLMEALGMVLVAALAYGLSLRPGGISDAMPILGALALGAQRLLPALQQSYHAWTNMAGSVASLADTLDLLDQPLPPEAREPVPPPLALAHAIEFDDVRFRYASPAPWVLDGFSLRIAKGTHIGIVGSTGSGKSTALDLLMGLLQPTHGRILVDGQPIGEANVMAWRRAVAHVPQSIYLADTSLAENIALGTPVGAINMERVKLAARQAQIAEFIESRPEGYRGLVGERGIRLSGGQRQRIGIARALYKQATVLVFDEATSALDTSTEQSIMQTIEGLSRDLTIILVAHRLGTVRRCDTIVVMENGRAVAQGTYDQLNESSTTFRHMVQAGG